jgi:hypothetical protein
VSAVPALQFASVTTSCTIFRRPERQADIDEGVKPGTTTGDSAELRDARRRIKLRENEVLRRAAAYPSQSNLPGKALPLVNELAPTESPWR